MTLTVSVVSWCVCRVVSANLGEPEVLGFVGAGVEAGGVVDGHQVVGRAVHEHHRPRGDAGDELVGPRVAERGADPQQQDARHERVERLHPNALRRLGRVGADHSLQMEQRKLL